MYVVPLLASLLHVSSGIVHSKDAWRPDEASVVSKNESVRKSVPFSSALVPKLSDLLLKETQNINSSLSTLSNVIEKLQAGDKVIPYRDSKLTSLLQNSLGGNSKTLCIVCGAPGETHFHETLCSLKFAAKVNRVDLKAKQNFSC